MTDKVYLEIVFQRKWSDGYWFKYDLKIITDKTFEIVSGGVKVPYTKHIVVCNYSPFWVINKNYYFKWVVGLLLGYAITTNNYVDIWVAYERVVSNLVKVS